ncbi:Uncharacterised protein [Bordetella pertussis]|nr:Uncharacterised protein [Bordetella pertussis]CFV97555.1 Uncharacterised protein [Bordetella pertussis]
MARPSRNVTSNGACAWSVSASRAARAATSNARRSATGNAATSSPAQAWATMALSKSSPPSAVSPPVAITSNTPWVRRRMEISNVPPPRSYTA